MSNNTVARWKAELRRIDEALDPFTGKPIDFERLDNPFDPDEIDQMDQIKADAQPLLREIIDGYIEGDDRLRETIRGLFASYENCEWALGYQMRDQSSPEIKRHIAMLSISDQGRDARDFMLACQSFFNGLRESGIDYRSELSEIASISSAENRMNFGSTENILRKWLR